MMGEEGVEREPEATRLIGSGGGGGRDDLGGFVTGDFIEFGRLGNFGGIDLRLAFCQSRVMIRSIVGLAKEAVERFS